VQKGGKRSQSQKSATKLFTCAADRFGRCS